MTKTLIVLTHVGEGPYVGMGTTRKAYNGRVVLDVDRIESIEEVNPAGETPVSYVTMATNSAHRVQETPDQIIALIEAAIDGNVVTVTSNLAPFLPGGLFLQPPSELSEAPCTCREGDGHVCGRCVEILRGKQS